MNILQMFEHNVGSKVVQAGQPIFRAGDAANGIMFILMEGRADIRIDDEVVEAARPGAIIGEISLIDDGPRSATVIARTVCRLLPIDKARFNALIQNKPEFASHVMQVMVGRIRAMNTRSKLIIEDQLRF